MERWRRISLITLCLLIWVPMIVLLAASFMSLAEILDRYGVLFSHSDVPVQVSILPTYPTLRAYFELLFDSPEFFTMFWNSFLQVAPVLLGQLIVAAPGAWAFSAYEFKGRKLFFLFYHIVMILPFQVTMVSDYLVLDSFHLLNTHLALVLPGIFSVFPVFIMVKNFENIPKALTEAARIDGAGEFYIFLHIGIPLGKSGIFSALLLSFFEQWNAIEQPITFLKDKQLWPLSLYLPNITPAKAATVFAAAAVMMVPCVMLSVLGEEYLTEGIVSSGIKE